MSGYWKECLWNIEEQTCLDGERPRSSYRTEKIGGEAMGF